MPLLPSYNFDQMHLGQNALGYRLLWSQMFLSTLLFCTYETQKSNTLCSNAGQMILQGHYFGLQDTPVLLKIIKINDFAIFHVITLSLCTFYLTINFTVFLQYLLSVVLLLSVTYFCYQSHTFVISHVLIYQYFTLNVDIICFDALNIIK